MKRHDQILALALVAQVALSVFIFWPRPAASGAGEPLFAGVEASDIVSLTVTDDQGVTTTLSKQGKEWVLPDADDYAADASKVTPVLDKIVGLNNGRLVTRTEASHKRLQVAADDFVRRVDFETSDGAKHTVYLGSSPSYAAMHFRLDGQDETYLSSDLSAWEVGASATSWVDPIYFSIDQSELQKVTLENANGTFAFTPEEDGTWSLEGLEENEQLASGAVSSLVSRATSVNLLRPLGKEEKAAYGLDDPAAVVTLEAEDRTITLLVGAKDPNDNSYAVKVSESSYFVRVASYNMEALVENAREDFLQPPPTPEGETPGTESSGS
jgi:hypothetical protein